MEEGVDAGQGAQPSHGEGTDRSSDEWQDVDDDLDGSLDDAPEESMADRGSSPEAEAGPESESESEAGPGAEPSTADAPGDSPAADSDGQAGGAGDGEYDGDHDGDDDGRGPGPGADLTDEQIAERTLSLLFASPDPLSVGRLVGLLERPPAARVRAALDTIRHQLESGPLPVQLRALKGGYTLMTVPEMGEVVGRLAKGSPIERISPAALETLAIVAYRQPVTKAEIEAIRGVQAGPILRSLVDRGLAKVTGRADVPGHPLQYGTTKDFLDRFGLMNLDELPRDAELAKD